VMKVKRSAGPHGEKQRNVTALGSGRVDEERCLL